MDALLYQIWLWMSFRWFRYRITGMDKNNFSTEVIIFATEDADMERILGLCKEQERDKDVK
jgi:hypothetical protein